MKRVSIYIDKGGTGKTTCAAHIGTALDRDGHDVLLVDLAGKQGDLADALGIYDRVQSDIESGDDFPNVGTTMGSDWHDVADLLGRDEALDRLTYETESGPDLIPAHESLDALDADLGNVDAVDERYSRFDQFLAEYVEPSGRWDVLVIDMPGLANNITYNGLWATENVLTPVAMGSFEFKQAETLEEDLKTIRNDYAIDVELEMLIPNLYDRRTNLHEEMLEKFRDTFPESIAPEYVVDTQQIRSATDDGITIFDIPDDELSSTAADARTAFELNAAELYQRL